VGLRIITKYINSVSRPRFDLGFGILVRNLMACSSFLGPPVSFQWRHSVVKYDMGFSPRWESSSPVKVDAAYSPRGLVSFYKTNTISHYGLHNLFPPDCSISYCVSCTNFRNTACPQLWILVILREIVMSIVCFIKDELKRESECCFVSGLPRV
jgi:hypothetical protein